MTTYSFSISTESQLNIDLSNIDIGGNLSTPNSTYDFFIGSNIQISDLLQSINISSNSELDIIGGGYTIDGGSLQGGFTLLSGQLFIENLTMSDFVAQGGVGGSGDGSSAAGGGGGGGLGGALFVAAGAVASLDGVNLHMNQAIGGSGGSTTSSSGGLASGGGGGMSINGPYANGVSGNNIGALYSDGGGGGAYGGAPGQPGGYGGGGGGVSTPGSFAGPGGFGGGGGGGNAATGYGGNGGFGGGGGGGATPGIGGYGGGNGNRSNGGGGLGAGGAIFVQQGGSLTLGNVQISGNSVSGGGPAGANSQGEALGSGLFLGSDISLLPGDTLTITDSVAGPGLIDLNGGTISLQGLAGSTTNYDPATHLLTTSGGSSVSTLTLDTNPIITSSGNNLLISACYAEGTRIETADGAVPIEMLQPGQMIRTANGRLRPVIWMGRRHISTSHHPRPWDVQPIRVLRHAFGLNLPKRDLFLSPDHSIFAEGVLIPIRYLCNGATILQESWSSVTYWHLELDQHDIILAEGLPAESYLDTGNRGAFENSGPVVSLLPDFGREVWETDGCAPLTTAGTTIDMVKFSLAAQAGMMGYNLSDNPNLQLAINSDRIALNSNTFIPAEVIIGSDDHRRLGVAVARIEIDGRPVQLDDPRLVTGWHPPEGILRWTNGHARVLASNLSIEIIDVGAVYWQTTKDKCTRIFA